MKNRRTKDLKLQALKQLPLFASLNNQDLQLLGRVSDRLTVPAGTRLSIQDRVATHLTIIVEGTASVAIDDCHVAVLGNGAYVGEISLIDDQRSTATVTTMEPTTIWHIARAGLLPVWQANPQMAAVLVRDIASKLRATDELLAQTQAPAFTVATNPTSASH